MADIYLKLAFEYVEGEPDPVPPPMGSCGTELYDAIAPLAYEDHLNGWPLAHLCEAIGRMRQAVSDIVRDSDDGPGWSLATDVDRAPGAADEIDLLPFLGQLAGVRGIEGMGDADRRAAIREREGFRRGTPQAIVSAARRYTDGTPGAVTLRERYDPNAVGPVDAPYHGRVLIKRSRLRPDVDEAELRRRVLASVPAGLDFDVWITNQRDYDEVVATWPDYDAVARAVENYDRLLEG